MIQGYLSVAENTRPVWELVEKLIKRSREESGMCLFWTGSADKKGYGWLKWDGRSQYTHRLSYKTNVGPIPDGFDVCHRCDNPPCLNPAHLFAASRKVNMCDAREKGRTRSGELHWKARLTEADVIDIRSLSAFGATARELSDQFGVALCTVYDILSGRTWTKEGRKGKANGRRKESPSARSG